MLDIVIKNGKVIDGSGAPWYCGNVGIKGDTIVLTRGGEPPEAARVIDAAGKFVCPGFIDIHSHTDTAVIRSPERAPKVTQGVTTEVYSNCGGGVAPVTKEGRQRLRDYSSKLASMDFDWLSVADFLERVPAAGVNTAYLVPHGALRVSAMGYAARHSTPEEIAQMCDLAVTGMEDGAFGLSTGLAYVPMSSCQTEEVTALAKVVARYGGILADHMRNYREKVLEGVRETVEITRDSGVAMQISHYQAYGTVNWGKGGMLLGLLDDARRDGLDITFDSYPYDFSAGGLKNTIPAKYHEGGLNGLLRNLAEPAVREALRKEIGTVTTYDLNLLTAVGVTKAHMQWIVGKSIPQIAEALGKDNVDALCDVLLEDPGILHVNFQGNAADVAVLAESALQMVGSDSPDVVKGESRPHPRLWGTFPRFLRLFAREKPVLSWEQAVYKMTGFPAWRMGFHRRGLLRAGFAADVVVFDPATVCDMSTMLSPDEPAVGIDWVIVNGQVELASGAMTSVRAGRVLRRGQD